jgi:hypothetical protein
MKGCEYRKPEAVLVVFSPGTGMLSASNESWGEEDLGNV